MRPWRDPIVWSHGPLLAAGGIWGVGGAWIAAAVVLLSTAVSVAHHRARESDAALAEADHRFAVAALFVTLAHFALVADGMAMLEAGVLLGAALLCKELGQRYDYSRWHTAWHLMVAAGQAFIAWHWLAAEAPRSPW